MFPGFNRPIINDCVKDADKVVVVVPSKTRRTGPELELELASDLSLVLATSNQHLHVAKITPPSGESHSFTDIKMPFFFLCKFIPSVRLASTLLKHPSPCWSSVNEI